MPELLARVDVGEMDFDHRQIAGGDGIAQRDAGVRVTGGVDHDGNVRRAGGILNPRHQFAFVVGLAELNLRAPFRLRAHGSFDFRQCGGAVNFRLPLAEQVQVRAVEEKEFSRGKTNCCARGSQLQFQQTRFQRHQFLHVGVQRALGLLHQTQVGHRVGRR